LPPGKKDPDYWFWRNIYYNMDQVLCVCWNYFAMGTMDYVSDLFKYRFWEINSDRMYFLSLSILCFIFSKKALGDLVQFED
jgi:hypothetical protein